MGMLWTTLPKLLDADTHPERWGMVTGVASALGLATGAAFGRLSDVHGRQLVLLLAVLIFASANLFLSVAQLPAPLWEALGVAPATVLVLGALLGRCVTTSGALRKALVADLSPASGRTTALGRLAACGGAGFVVGPTLAGQLVAVDVAYAVRAQLLLAVGAVSIAVSIWRTTTGKAPEAAKAALETSCEDNGAACSSSGFSPLQLLWSETVGGLMAASFFLSFGFQAFVSSFYLYCVRRFGFGPQEYGRLLSALGVTWTTTQALLIPALRRSGWPEPTMLLAGSGLLICGRLTLAVAHTVPVLLLGELLVVSGAATCFTISSSLLSQAVSADQVGATMGMTSALESFCGIVAPPIVGWLTESAKVGESAGALVAAGSNGVACMLLFYLRAKGHLTIKSKTN